MRTPSTKTIEDKSPSNLWSSLSKMFSEWKFQTTVAEGQYVASRDSNLKDLEEVESEIAKLRAAIRELTQRKQLNKRDQRILQDLQEQLKLRLSRKERLAQMLNSPPTKRSDNNKEVNLEESKHQ